MKLDKLILENFLTYEHLDYNISRSPLLVQGKNLTEEDQESNGSGKSGIFTAIEFCIAASNSRDVRDKELVMFGEKEARAQLFASCDVRKESLHIDWKIKVKGSNILTLKKKSQDKEWEEVVFSNVNDGKKFVLSWFAIEKEDLFNYYIINKTRFKSFFKASNKEKVDLINRFSDASIIDGLEKIDNTQLQTEYDQIKSTIDKIEGKIELTDEQLADELVKDSQTAFDDQVENLKKKIEDAEDDKLDVNDEIKEIKNKLKADQSILDELNNKVTAVEDSVKYAQDKVDSFVDSDFDSEISAKQDLIQDDSDLLSIEEDQLDAVLVKQSKINKLIKELSIELSGAITCPSCTHKFTLDCKHGTLEEVKAKDEKAKQLLDQVNTIESNHEDKIDTINKRIEKVRDAISKIADKRDVEYDAKKILDKDLNDVQLELNKLNKDIVRIEGDIAEHNTDIKDCKSDIKASDLAIKGFKSDLKELKVENNEVIIGDLRTSLDVLRRSQISKEQELSLKGDEIYMRNQWTNNFKQFRAHLANQSLEAIEFHMNRYLVGMGSDLKVKLEGFKMLANGTFKDEITAKIIRTVERTFSSFSGGEQGRLLFAAILANRHMINSTHPYGGLDFLSIDEVFEGVDSLGLKSLVKSAKQLEISVMIITHVTDEEVSDDILLIEKINGRSYVKN